MAFCTQDDLDGIAVWDGLLRFAKVPSEVWVQVNGKLEEEAIAEFVRQQGLHPEVTFMSCSTNGGMAE